MKRILADKKFYDKVFDTMQDGLMVLDTDGNILMFNQAAERITGYSRDEVKGQPCTILDTDTCVIMTGSGRQKKCELFDCGSVTNKRCRIRTKQGKTTYLLKNAVVLYDDDKQMIGAVETMTDITSLYMKELEILELKEELRRDLGFMGLLGKSPSMQILYEKIKNAATSEAPVLICGESGTGKELVANAIHVLSRRRSKPFVKLNCGAINEHLMESELFGHKKGSFTGAVSDRKGRFEAADTGSIVLDEIGDMPLLMQVKLLRVLEQKVVEPVGDHRPVPVDVRLISSTNKDLNRKISANEFREDLFYRINSITIETVPLRHMKEDIPILAAHYLKKIALVNDKTVFSINSQAMEVFQNYEWPGNVRQLVNALEHCAITCKGENIQLADLPDYVFPKGDFFQREKMKERETVLNVLANYKGNRTLTAKHLGISRVTLWKRLKKYGFE